MKYSVIFSIILFAASRTFAQVDERVFDIRKKVEQINNDTGYVIKTLENDEFLDEGTDGGGSLTGYFKKGLLVKIDLWAGLSSCIDTYEYYLKNNSLIFVYGQEKVFEYVDSIATFDSNKQSVAMECRYYFGNEQLIKTDFKGEARCGFQPSEDDTKRLLSECAEYSELLKKN